MKTKSYNWVVLSGIVALATSGIYMETAFAAERHDNGNSGWGVSDPKSGKGKKDKGKETAENPKHLEEGKGKGKGKDKAKNAKVPDGGPCVSENRSAATFEAHFAAVGTCFDRRIGNMAVNGLLEGEALGSVLAANEALKIAYANAMKDNKISAEERRKLKELRKGVQAEIHDFKWNKETLDKRMDRIMERMTIAKEAGELTQEEFDALKAKHEDLVAKAGTLDASKKEDVKKFREDLRAFTDEVYNERSDEGEGNGKKMVVWAEFDEKQKNLNAQLIACDGAGKLSAEEFNSYMTELKDLDAKEREAKKDSVLSEEESGNLNAVFSQAKGNVDGKCKDTTVVADDQPEPSETGKQQKPKKDKKGGKNGKTTDAR